MYIYLFLHERTMIFRGRGKPKDFDPIARYGEHCALRIIRHASWQRIIALAAYRLST